MVYAKTNAFVQKHHTKKYTYYIYILKFLIIAQDTGKFKLIMKNI